MNFPPKAISVLLLVQCLFIGIGYALTRKMVRWMEKIEPPNLMLDALPNYAAFVFKTGLWAFLIPLLWAVWVSLHSGSHQGIPLIRSADAKITVGLTVVTVCLWPYAALQAMDVAFGFHGPITVVNHSN
ncbi:hypothetical protein [Prosthecobacter sp.]|uniref:hypothetical protein n=1 Tax=Prosthecobacter sp. TaxID=1965333 RepID=UPI00248793CE|nr:hypothetical protein [Prosthecobacter sp.]MDI1315453.1 hypothetical protein [Prosthecobacter sp.]